ncbi:hypothetical protein HPB48_024368 [Haemaphysalis longicornis]|uniref:Mitogen activated protein kinase kinase kinase 1 n=1 Tax=Haemaphysalis longicornis TaxID=44386 RepID=A0A9J6H6K4_HAELO|nr:hypothetical protein HPB48_024368 [Haemaphysalis longicornis]
MIRRDSTKSHPGDMATQLDRLQQVHPVSVRDIKEKLQAHSKNTSAGASWSSHPRRAPLCVKHDNAAADERPTDGTTTTSSIAPQREGTGASFATKRPSRKPSPPPPPVRPPEAPDPPCAVEGSETTRTTTTPRHRSTTPTSRRSSCSCARGPHCVHLLFVMLRVLRVTDTDARLFRKTLKDFEVDELLQGFSVSRRRSSQQSDCSLTDPNDNFVVPYRDEASTCPICLLEMFEGESVVTCEKGCRNRLHHHCSAIWALECSRNGDPVHCPLCRCCWQDGLPTKEALQLEEDEKIPGPPCPLHCLLRRASDASPLPRPVGMHPPSATSPPPTLVMQFFGTEVAQCLVSTVWSEREAAVVEVEAQVTHALRQAVSKPMCLEPWGGIEAVQAACCRVIAQAIADPVYRVYVTALRCFKSMLVLSPCAMLEDLRNLQDRVRNIVRAVLIKCADGGNKRSRQLSLATLAELARGQLGALSVGSLTRHPAPDGLGADFLLDVVLSEGKRSPSWQGLLSQLLVLERLAEEFPPLLTSPIATTGTINSEALVAIDLAVRAVRASSRGAQPPCCRAWRACAGRCPTAVARIWDGVAALQGPLRPQLVRRISLALQEARKCRLLLATTSSRSPSAERQQEEYLVREQLLHDKRRVGKDEDCNDRRRLSQPVNSPSRMAAFQLPPPTIDPALLGQLVQSSKESSSEVRNGEQPSPKKHTAKKQYPDSWYSSSRSSWSSSSATSSSENKSVAIVETPPTALPAAVPPLQRALRSRPNFLPLRRLACSLTSLGQGGQLSSAQTTPGSAVTSPVSFSREIAALSSAKTSLRTGAVINQGSLAISTRGFRNKIATSEENSGSEDAEDSKFIIFNSVAGLPMLGAEKEANGSVSYVEGVHWHRGHLLGAGAFSSCFQAVDRATGTLLAVKQLSFCRSCSSSSSSSSSFSSRDRGEGVADGEVVGGRIWDEIQVMARLDHPHVLPLLGATRHQNCYNVFLEWMAGGSVASLLERYGAFSEAIILRYAYQTLSGLAYLHENHVLHRDLKGANLLVDSTGRHLKIADFGSASRLRSQSTQAGEFQGQLLGTIAFMAPEVLRGENYGRSCDVWSVGCVLIEMATKSPPWGDFSELNQLALIYRISCAQSPPTVPDRLSLRTQHLALQCLQLRSEDRPSASELLSHPAFEDASVQPQDP